MNYQTTTRLLTICALGALSVGGCATPEESEASESAAPTSSWYPTHLTSTPSPTSQTSGRIEGEIGSPVGLLCPTGTMESCEVQFTVTGIRQINPSSCYESEPYDGTYVAIDVEVVTSPVFSQPEVAQTLRWNHWSYIDDRGVTVINKEAASGCFDDWNPDALYGELRPDSKLEATLPLKTPNGIQAVRLDPPQTQDNWEWDLPA